MWQSIIELLKQFFSSISSVSDTTKEFVPIIEKNQEIRTPVKIKEAENDVIRKIIKGEDIIGREIRKDLINGFYDDEIIQHYKNTIDEDVTYILKEQKEKLKNNKKRLRNIKNK